MLRLNIRLRKRYAEVVLFCFSRGSRMGLPKTLGCLLVLTLSAVALTRPGPAANAVVCAAAEDGVIACRAGRIVYAGAALVTCFGASRTSTRAVASRLLATA